MIKGRRGKGKGKREKEKGKTKRENIKQGIREEGNCKRET